MEPTIVHANGAELCVETFGDQSDPAILLVMGAGASMDWWEDEFCERLAAGSRYVVRYDHRDTGQSTSYPSGAPGYTGDDLVADPVVLLDVLDLGAAHVVGLSMGGAIAQRLGLDHPDRVASLTLMSTSPAGPVDRDLPPMGVLDSPPPPDWSDRDAVIDFLVDGLRPYAGTLPYDESATRALVARVVDRTTNVESSQTNHWILPDDEEESTPRIGEIRAPTLVMHGTADPLFPYGHGEALSAAIPGATLLPLKGVGHEFPPPPVWDVVVPALLTHTAGG